MKRTTTVILRMLLLVSVISLSSLLVHALGGDIYQDGETCLKCHDWNKKGHQEKKEDCARCHNPGEKKEVHNVAPVEFDVSNPDEWQAVCSGCHTWNKSGHQEKKKDCLPCHGSGKKHDVHVEHEEKEVDIDCTTCHGVPDEGPEAHLEECGSCHEE